MSSGSGRKSWPSAWRKSSTRQKRVEALHYDLGRTRDTIEGQLLATEEVLAGMQVTHQTLAEELRSRKASFQEELCTELEVHRSPGQELMKETKPSTQLRSSAADFIPSVNPFPPGADGSTHSVCARGGALHRPPPYDGHTSWEAYQAQFDMLAQTNCWTEAEKSTLLAVSLRETALTVLSNLTTDHRGDYGALVAVLKK